MFTDKLITAVLGIFLAIAMAVIIGLFINSWQLSQQLTEANNTITAHAQNVAVLDTAVTIQNNAIDSLVDETDKAIDKSEQALVDLKPFVDEEERRILGIRSAQHSSVSSDSAERLENIRQKMLKDALL
jgi:predicted PurR-regulated permease PerM